MKLKRGLDKFIEGMSNITLFPNSIKLEDYNSNYSNKLSLKEQDAKSLADDWKKVSDDINYILKIK